MRISKFATLVVFVAGLGLTAALTATAAQDKDKKPAPPAAKPDAKPQAQHEHEHDMTATMPGPEHAFLAKYVGEFTTVSTMTQGGAELEPPSSGTAKIRGVLGGRFFMEENAGTAMGMPYEGIHYTGYNSASKKYEGTWSWSMDTGMLHLIGSSPDGGKTINWITTMTDSAGNEVDLKVLSTYTDADHFTIALSADDPAGALMMETVYTRKK